MDWTNVIRDALDYIEKHLTEDMTPEQISQELGVSSFYFQKGFSIMCGYSVSDYIRNRKLTMAGQDLLFSEMKIIDIAIKYGYDSADGFTKAFTRFHGVTPLVARKNKDNLRSFSPLKVKIVLDGGPSLEYRVERKPKLFVVGCSRLLRHKNARMEIDEFWDDYLKKRNEKDNNRYGVALGNAKDDGVFEYIIGDVLENKDLCSQCAVVRKIPSLTWAVFPCKNGSREDLKDINIRIFTEWLPALKEYELEEGCAIEYYRDNLSESGIREKKMSGAEIWVPIKKKL